MTVFKNCEWKLPFDPTQSAGQALRSKSEPFAKLKLLTRAMPIKVQVARIYINRYFDIALQLRR